MDASRKLTSKIYKVATKSYNIWRHSIHTSPLANEATSTIELLSKKLIKPSSPTPPHLKSYKLSHLDQRTVGTYTSFAIFYPRDGFSRDNNNEICKTLEKSLSETLSSYYPLAGRLHHNIEIECNDSGASFSEVGMSYPMSEIMSKPDPVAEDLLFPSGVRWSYEKQECLLYIQLTHFSCGGKAIALSMSHKATDGCAFTNFISDWAAVTRGLKPDSPHFNGASLFPPINGLPDSPILELQKEPVINKRYLFTGDSLSRLKARVASESEVKNPSRVEVISALLYKCAVAATSSSAGIFKPSNMLHLVNLRQLATPQLPPKTFGNFYCYLDVSIANEEEMKISRLVNELRLAKIKTFERCRGLKQSELLSIALEGDKKVKSFVKEHDLYLSSSFLNYPWWLDFGWGKPVKAIFPYVDSKNVLLQMESSDGVGVQVQVTLDAKVMPIFEKEEEILEFTSE